MCHGTHEAFADHIVGDTEDGSSRRCLLRGANGGRPDTNDDIDVGLGQLCCMLPELLGAQPITLSVGLEILTLDETEPAQLVIKRVMNRRTRHGGQGADAVVRPGSCPRTAGGHANIVPPNRAIRSRRLSVRRPSPGLCL